MFSKTCIVFFIAVFLIKPNEAIFGIDTAIQNAVTSIITTGNSTFQTVNATLSTLSQIATTVNTLISSAVSAAGGSQAKISSCIQKHQASITAFQISTITKIANICVRNNLTQTISLIISISATSNNITSIISNANSTVATACPPPAAGDIFGGINNGACTLGIIAQLTAQVAQHSVTFVRDGVQAVTVISSLGPIDADPVCVLFQLGLVSFDAAAIIIPILQCISS